MFIVNLNDHIYNDMIYNNYLYNDLEILEIEEQIINIIETFDKNKELFYITLIFIFTYLFIMFFPLFKHIKIDTNKFLILFLNLTKFFLITGLMI